MVSHFRPAFVLLALFTALLGLAYPLAVTGIAQIAFPHAANGSPLLESGKIIGSELIGQNFAAERYFHPRPSATSAADPADASKTVDAPYNAANSSGSNLGPLSQKLVDRVKTDLSTLAAGEKVPADAATASASGLDPHISPENALRQAASVAKARGVAEAEIAKLVQVHTEGRLFGLLGEPRVNVLLLNIALDKMTGKGKS